METAEKQLENYKIYAPITGTIIKQDAANGDAAERGSLLSTISDPDHMQFSIPIDELDIAKIQVGQNVSITVDALPESSDAPLTGQVSRIAVEGTSSNGVTTYPVTVGINETSKLKAGMNANAEIMVNQKTGVLMVPLEAIQKVEGRNFVIVMGGVRGSENNAAGINGKSTSDDNSKSAYNNNSGNNNQSGAIQGNTNTGNKVRAMRNKANGNVQNAVGTGAMRPVELGINNDDYAEVLSGLQEGEQVVLPTLATGTGQNNMQIKGIGGMGFGAVGAVPGAGSNIKTVESRTNRSNSND